METVVVKLKNDKARKLLADLADLDIIELMETVPSGVTHKSDLISSLKSKVASPMQEDAIDKQLENLRKEWQINS